MENILLINDLLAQLGEHHLDRVGVGGSSPSQVIILNKAQILVVSRVWAFSLFSDISILSLYFYTLHKYCTETARDCRFVLQSSRVPLFVFMCFFVHYVQKRSSNRLAVFFCISSFVCE